VNVEVCYAETDRATRIDVVVEPGATVAAALAASGIVNRLALDPDRIGYAIFGRRAAADTTLHEGDRVEVLRPLVVDPKEARRRRVAKKRTSR